jgi:aryl-alcohol dehydrogenase-like predicted oxidoreductase
VYDEDKLYDTIEELVAIGSDHGVSAAQIALAYTMGKPAVTSVIVGARTDEQLADNLASADLTLSAEEMERLDKVSAQPLPYPYWHQGNTSSDRLSPADLTLLARHIKG